MPALNFMKRFAPLVESGRKTTTIRAFRKDGRDPKPGVPLFLYTGMRQRGCRKLRDETCRWTQPITINADGAVILGRRKLTRIECRVIARDDGFEDFDEMFAWFRDVRGLPFSGVLIGWREFK